MRQRTLQVPQRVVQRGYVLVQADQLYASGGARGSEARQQRRRPRLVSARLLVERSQRAGDG